MTDNVVTFKGKTKEPETPPERLIYVCHCGCRTFNMFEDGNIVCSYCDCEIGEGAADGKAENWRRVLPPPPAVVEKDDRGTVNEHQLADQSMARRSVVKSINKWSDADRLAMIYAYDMDGAGNGWFNISSNEQRDWIVEKLEEVLKWTKELDCDGADEGTDTQED